MIRITLFFSCIIGNIVFSQQLPIFSNFLHNDYLINPALTGNLEYSTVQLSYRNQWTGFNGPNTAILGGHHSFLDKNMGLGGALFLDDLGGSIKQMGIMMNYSYLIKLNEKSLFRIGASGLINQYTFDGSDIQASSQNDPSLFGFNRSIVPDANFGLVYIFNDAFLVGFSINQIFSSSLKSWNIEENNGLYINRLARQYNFQISYNVKLNEQLAVQPYSVVRTTFLNPIQFELGSRLEIKKNYFLGILYRSQDAFSVSAGINIKDFIVFYSYDITTSRIQNFSSGSHEVILGYRFSRNSFKKTPKL